MDVEIAGCSGACAVDVAGEDDGPDCVGTVHRSVDSSTPHATARACERGIPSGHLAHTQSANRWTYDMVELNTAHGPLWRELRERAHTSLSSESTNSC